MSVQGCSESLRGWMVCGGSSRAGAICPQAEQTAPKVSPTGLVGVWGTRQGRFLK